MIALDTSVLLRYLTADHPQQAARAAWLVDGDETVGVCSLVLLESVHVLRSGRYGRDNPQLADTLLELLSHENVELTDLDADLAMAAIAGVRHLSARHLADALIGACARQAGARLLVTGDDRFASELVPVAQLAELVAEGAP